MWRQRVGAHDAHMFPTPDLTRALVAERQGTFRDEARQSRLARRGHRSWRDRKHTPRAEAA
jgi:hypothetical protein